MKIKLLLSIAIGMFCLPSVVAQVENVGIIRDLESSVAGEGAIHVECDQKIKDLLGTPAPNAGIEESAYMKMNGFRIQIFMSNNSKTAKGEAGFREGQIRENFSELATYIVYESPNWKLLAGDFMTKEEAGIFMQRIQKAFPGFGKEMYIVSDKVNIPQQKPW
jgi:hypothetical protein